jgi:hypothetical protein
MKLLGSMNVNGKQFTEKDSIGLVKREQLGIEDNFYGGSVKEFYKTKEGVYLCLNGKREIINTLVLDESILDKPFSNESDNVDREALIAQAKELGIKGALVNMKNETLMKKIKEAQENGNE